MAPVVGESTERSEVGGGWRQGRRSRLAPVVGESTERAADQTAVDLSLAPGRVVGLIGEAGSGLTSLGIGLVSAATRREPVAVLDVLGWFCPLLAWEAGIDPERLVVVRCPDHTNWPKVAAALFEGFPVVYAEVPRHVPDAALRRLGALARARRSGVVLRSRGDLPAGFLHVRVEGVSVRWEGIGQGHGRLWRRRLTVKASGKGARGMEQYLEVEGDGANHVRLVPRLAIAPAGRATG